MIIRVMPLAEFFAVVCCILLCFAGCSAATDDGKVRRLRVLKHIIDLFQTLNLSMEITTELTGLLLNEVLHFSVFFIEIVDILI